MTYCADELATPRVAQMIAVDYRLAPEHAFPAAVIDCAAGYIGTGVHCRAWAVQRINASRVAVGGDSAGGNLAAVVSIMARDEGGPPIRFQLLIYPGTEMRSTAASHRTNGQGYLLTSDEHRLLSQPLYRRSRARL